MSCTTLLLLASTFVGQAPETPEARPAADPELEAARAKEAKDVAKKVAEAYTIFDVSHDAMPLKFEAEPLLRWSNPANGSFHGSVFIWTAKGRPEVIASIYKMYNPPGHLGVEFHALSAGRVEAQRDGDAEWAPQRGVEIVPIPGAPTPGDSPAARLRQMRAMARELTASKTNRQNLTRPLRLLSQPLYRYKSPPEVIDGALFAFVDGTDPEIVLQVEARRSDHGLVWFSTTARLQNVSMRINRDGKEIWSVPTLPWAKAFDRSEAYTLIIFHKGEGLNP